MKRIGNVGFLHDELSDEYGFWRLVTEKGFSPSELDNWSLDEIDKANAMLDMGNDWQMAYQEMIEAKSRQQSEK